MAEILIIEDDPKICRLLSRIIGGLGHGVLAVNTLADGLARASAGRYDVVLLDLTLPDGNGLRILPDLASTPSAPEVIIVTGTGDQSGAEVAFKSGAWDFIPKPFMPEDVALPLTRALQYRSEKRTTVTRQTLRRENIIGDSGLIRNCLDLVAQAAASDANVLITGETGTGKELFARAIHENSLRSGRAFVVVDCASNPENLIESALFGHEKGAFTGADREQTGLVKEADKGTLFLDEVGELTLSMQKAFLRVLQERRFRPIGSRQEVISDFRLVAATNRDLDAMVEEGRFRLDLLHRLRALTIHLPPLRDHQEDIEDLVLYYLRSVNRAEGRKLKGVTPEFIKALESYDWKGNIRELFNTIEYALANAGASPTLYQVNLPPHVRLSKLENIFDQKAEGAAVEFFDLSREEELPDMKDYRQKVIEESEKAYLIELMRRVKGGIKQACAIAGLSESRLHALLKKYDTPRFRSTPNDLD